MKSLAKKKHKEYLSKIEKAFSSNPQVFWTYHKRSKQNTKLTYNGITSKSPAQKAELLNLYFCSVFTRPNVNI